MEHQNEEQAEPVSPVGQYFNSSVLCIYIVAVLEFEVPIDDLQAYALLRDFFLPINPRFSSIMVTDEDGKKRWKQVDVNLKDHVNIPIFPEGKTVESYDKYFHDYLSSIAMEQLPQSRPLWEIHIINYPTNGASSSVIFKLHHALGDVSDFVWSVLKSSIISDDKTPIRFRDEGADFQPISISSMTFTIDHIKDIKSRLGVTINDVITGIVFYGTRLYMQDMDSKSNSSHSTALVLLNTRNIEGVVLTGTLLEIEGKLRGQEAVAKRVRDTLSKSSVVISNLVGLAQQMSLANHPVKDLYFTLAGGPESYPESGKRLDRRTEIEVMYAKRISENSPSISGNSSSKQTLIDLLEVQLLHFVVAYMRMVVCEKFGVGVVFRV
ncbi:hypothetical protein Fmac_017585 [Flemingia macrophylla]|uniref:Diacylglycerol O-acyltransferase n=1 Tax=Flemingia macrophylla TaxID=520843 RepID=A0ABD1M2I1_9FABA